MEDKSTAEKSTDTRRLWEKRLTLALDIAEQMVISGAEVTRTEYSIRRICKSFGAFRVEALSITTSLIVTVYLEDISFTQTRRVNNFAYNMDRLEKMNELSREICDNHLNIKEARSRFNELMEEKSYSLKTKTMFSIMIAFTFTIFFGGSFRDALAASFIAIIFKLIDRFATDKINKFIPIIFSSVIGGFLAIIIVKVGFADSISAISIGDVMLLIPGILLTNSLRDMFSGDTITGGVRFIEASLVAMMIAMGFSASSFYADIAFEEPISKITIYSPPLIIIITLACAFFGTIGYAGSFNAGKKRFIFSGLGGGIGWAFYLLFSLHSVAMGYFVAAVVINIYSEIMARLNKAPATVFLVSAIMPLVPGGVLYNTMRYAVLRDWKKFGETGVSAFSAALALAMGILIANSFVKSIRKIRAKMP